MRERVLPPSPSRRGFLKSLSIAGAGTALAAVGSVANAGAADAALQQSAALIGDGTTDDAPAIQAAYDAGRQPAFAANRTYYLNSPIFLDRPTSLSMFVLELNGAILKLGPNLPTTDAFWRETAVKWAFFPNTKRTALQSGKVDVSVNTRASGTNTGALISLIVRNGTIDGNGANVGFAFANRTAARFESVVLRRGRALLSWTDYSDANVFLQCHNRAGGPANSVLVEQVSSGDGLLMQSCKADAAVGLARLKYCRGAEIVGTVTGRIELDACSAIQIRGGHQEAPIINQTMVDIRSSDVVIDTTALYLTRGQAGDALPPVVRIADSGSPASSVVIRDSIEMRALVRSDEQLGSLVAIERAVPGTRLEARGLTAVVSVRDIGGLWSRSVGPSIGGASAVTSAVSRSLATVASGDFKLQDPGTGWVLSPTTAPVSATAATPSLWSLSTVEEIQGTLPAKGHRYRCQGRLAGGGYTPASAFTSWVTPTRGALRFLLAANGAVQEMRIWRFVGTSATANAYVAVPAAALTHTLYDTGANVNGFGWKPGSTVPPPG